MRRERMSRIRLVESVGSGAPESVKAWRSEVRDDEIVVAMPCAGTFEFLWGVARINVRNRHINVIDQWTARSERDAETVVNRLVRGEGVSDRPPFMFLGAEADDRTAIKGDGS
jgi:hypothetical protein